MINELQEKASKNIRPLYDSNGEVIGRALITFGYAVFLDERSDLSGVVTVGGLTACSMTGIAGILMGVPMRASRDSAKPIVSDSELKRWAEEQSALVPLLWEDESRQAACAQ